MAAQTRMLSIFQALTRGGQLITVNQASKTGMQRLTCPMCKREVKLIARSRTGTRAHFRHLGGKCEGPAHIGAETKLHFMAKEILLEQGMAYVPRSLVQPDTAHASGCQLVQICFDEPELEPTKDGYRPDLLVRVGQHWVALEVKVFSGCADAKVSTYAMRGISMVEVTIPPGTVVTHSSISRVLGNPANWHCHIDAPWLEYCLTEQARKILRSDMEIEAYQAAFKGFPRASLKPRRGRAIPSPYIGIILRCPTEPSYFLVPLEDWQQAVLDILTERAGQNVTLKEIYSQLAERELIAAAHLELSRFSLARLTHHEKLPPELWFGAQALADEYAVLGGQEVHSYLVRLAECRLVRPQPCSTPLADAVGWMMPVNVVREVVGATGVFH